MNAIIYQKNSFFLNFSEVKLFLPKKSRDVGFTTVSSAHFYYFYGGSLASRGIIIDSFFISCRLISVSFSKKNTVLGVFLRNLMKIVGTQQ
jgi:hypothetical protein